MKPIQVYDGDGFDYEAETRWKKGIRDEAVENQWMLIDYLDEFSHQIDAHQWHVPPKSMPQLYGETFNRRASLVEAYRKCIDYFYTAVHAEKLVGSRLIKSTLENLHAITSDNATDTFKQAGTIVYNILDRWRKELIQADAYTVAALDD